MAEIIGVRFKNRGKVYYFDPGGEKFNIGDLVVVETSGGIDCGDVSIANKSIDDDQIVKPLKKIVRAATEEDKNKLEENYRLGKEAYRIANEKIKEHDLDMKLVEVEYSFGSNKVLFYFTAEGRVDFRDLVKDLAAIFKTRIELRQIGVKDETKMIGGLGTCGRPFCCNQFLTEFYPVSIKMAKEQGLSLNPAKISGACGRLMCCLRYEQDTYERLRKALPKIKTPVMTSEGKGIITEVNVLTGNLKVKLEQTPAPLPVHVNDIKLIVGDTVSETNYENDHYKRKASKTSAEANQKIAFENAYNAIPGSEVSAPVTAAPPLTKKPQAEQAEKKNNEPDKPVQANKKGGYPNRRKKPFKQGEGKKPAPNAQNNQNTGGNQNAQTIPNPQNAPGNKNPANAQKRKKPRYRKPKENRENQGKPS